MGAQYAVLPYVHPKQRVNAEDWRMLIMKLERFGKRLREEGLQFAYHNHDFEFHCKIDEQYVFDAIYSSINEDLLQVEMDIGWVQYAGQDPLQYIAKYAGRLPLLHLKDFIKGEPGTPIHTVELGRGELALNEIIDAAAEAGTEWLILEQDRCEAPPLQSVQRSMEWLKEHVFNP